LSAWLYRQYFWPAGQPAATCVYSHEEAGETILFADYHRAVQRDVLTLPATLIGKPFTVVEKTPSLSVDDGATVPHGGVAVSVNGDYGYVVLRIRGTSGK
jgi:hypothetical protein